MNSIKINQKNGQHQNHLGYNDVVLLISRYSCSVWIFYSIGNQFWT